MTKPFFSPLPSYPARDALDSVPSVAQLAEAEIQALRRRAPRIKVKAAAINLGLAVQLFSSFRGEALVAEDFAAAVVGLSELPDSDPASLRTSDEDVTAVAHQLSGQGKVSEAEAILRQSVSRLRGKAGRYDARTLRAQSELAQVLRHENKTSEARRLLLQTVEAQREVLGTHHTDTLETLEHLAMLLVAQQDFAHAEPLLSEVVLVRHRTHGDAHLDSLRAIRNLAHLMTAKGDLSSAETMLRRALEHHESVCVGEAHLETLASQAALASVLLQANRPSEALALSRATLVARTQALGEAHVATLETQHQVALCLMGESLFEPAAEALARSLATARRALPKTHIFLADLQASLGRCHKALEQFDKAERLLNEAYDKMRAAWGLVDRRTQSVLGDLIGLYVAWGKPDKAASFRAANAACS